MTDFYPHQQEAINYFSDKNRGALHFTMRLGKSRTVLEILNRKKNASPIVIVAPLSAFSGWQNEIKTQFPEWSLTTLTGTKKQRERLIVAPKTDIYLINYDGLRIAGMVEQIVYNIRPNALVMDEAHRGKSNRTAQWFSCKKLAQACQYVFQLTGTPITQCPTDIWSQFEILQPGFFGNKYGFEFEYCNFKQISVPTKGGGRRQIRKFIGPRNTEKLSEKISELAIRKTAEECIKLPDIFRQKIEASFEPEQKKYYDDLERTLSVYLRGDKVEASQATTLMIKLRQICNGFLYTATDLEAREVHRFPSGKIEMLLDLLEDLAGERVVIFTDFIEDRERIREEITLRDKARHRPIEFEGCADKRDLMLMKFKEDPLAALIANIQSGSEGVDLSASDNFIYFGNTYSHAVRTQSEARGLHPEKKRPVTLYDLYIPKTPDETTLKILSMKGDSAAAITGDAVRLAQYFLESKKNNILTA